MTRILLPLLLALTLPVWGQTNFLRYPRCKVPEVKFIADTPTVKRGNAPTFTLVLRNDGTKAVDLIDVRQRRWQTFHASLKFLRGGREVDDLMVPISDPPVMKKDHFWLQPGAEERFKLHYEQEASELRADDYQAVVVLLDFHLPAPSSEGCLSNRVQFTVK